MSAIRDAEDGWTILADRLPGSIFWIKDNPLERWDGKRVIIIGAARQGLALARYLTLHGAEVVITDRLTKEELSPAIQPLGDLSIEWVLGSHPIEILENADLVCPSGGVPLALPLIQEAIRRDIPLSNDSQIFLEAAPCPVIGITGSAGKTTTTTLVGRMANAAVELLASRQAQELQFVNLGAAVFSRSPQARIWIGGNIGTPLISSVDRMQSGDLAILELSSFQLELMTRSPQLAAVLNITPNHLDRHSSMTAYWEAKARIIRFQSSEDVTVLGRDDPGAWKLADEVKGRLITFGMIEPPDGVEGTFLKKDGSALAGRFKGLTKEKEMELMPREIVLLRGEHNLANVLAACAIAAAAGLPVEAMRAGVQGFSGVHHRLEYVRTWHGAVWYNDSIATAPERAMAAIRSFDEPLVLLVGGRDKNLPWDDFARLVKERVDHLILFGEAAEIIQAAIKKAGQSQVKVHKCKDLHTAILSAADVAEPGVVVLLSPGGTSYDAFRDFEERGEAFKQWVMELPE
jgi:UDP-N-acetylmuramoylalanine--D-glutamate ligase